MKNNHFGSFDNQEKYKLNVIERKMVKKRLCRICGKELPFLSGQKFYHKECAPFRSKVERWR